MTQLSRAQIALNVARPVGSVKTIDMYLVAAGAHLPSSQSDLLVGYRCETDFLARVFPADSARLSEAGLRRVALEVMQTHTLSLDGEFCLVLGAFRHSPVLLCNVDRLSWRITR